MNNNLPQKRQENLFIKIRRWFWDFFRKQKNTENSLEKNAEIQENKNNFIEKIKVENKDKIIILQRKIEEKSMKISELTDQELEQLIEFYKEQIEMKKEKLKQYRKIIVN